LRARKYPALSPGLRQDAGVDAARPSDGQVAVAFTYAEAVVLSQLLTRMESRRQWEQVPFEDQAEQRVVWDLTASFEPLIDETFSTEYGEVLERARAEVRDPTE
jgi:hypothetical protein